MAREPASGRRSFGPVVLAGLAGSGLAALGTTRVWFEPVTRDPLGTVSNPLLVEVQASGGQVPLATSLALVCLAGWGVLLVTRGRVRRAAALLGLAAAVTLLGAWAWSWRSVPEALRQDGERLGIVGTDGTPTGWLWLSGAGALLALLAFAAAVRLAPGWPEMGRRYDSPTPPSSGDDAGNLDLWRALSEGRDPTEGPS